MADQQPQREWFEKDYYAILGVPSSAGQKDITKAYRRIARENHPDTNPGDKAAEERFKDASAAYDVVGDPEKRKQYDEVRRMATTGFGPPGGGQFTGDIGDLFENLFSGGGMGGGMGGSSRTRAGRRAPGTGPRRGADLEADLTLSFDDAVKGLETTVNLTSEAACSFCHGTGAAAGTAPVLCPTCGGRGVQAENQGLFSFSQLCATCGGRGKLVETPCSQCGGTATEVRPRQVKVRIPAGVADGQRIRLKGRGVPGVHGGPAGDLFVRVHVRGHQLFGRRGNDLTLQVPISFPEAALGTELTVPTLNGSPVRIRIPEGTPSGKTFRVRGKGISGPKGAAGDLLVTVEVAVPQKLSRAERKAVEALAAAATESPRPHLDGAAGGEAS